MPYSSDNGKKQIDRAVKSVAPMRILDVGAGSGTYVKRYRKPGQHWTGVEIWEPYVGKFRLFELYDTLLVQDAREPIPGEYDLAFAGDVLEHMEPHEARKLLDALRQSCQTVIVSIPIGNYPQEEYAGNPYERHVKDDWTDAQVRELLGEPVWSCVDGEIGVYIYSNHQGLADKMKLKIAVYAISKNESMFVERFCASAKDADLILIADTGSTDNTAELARQHGAVVHDICISPWRFDKARDTALALIPRDIDVCISLDLDEILEPGWREEIERVWTEHTTRLRYKFDWGQGIRFFYEKIHHRHGYHWHHPCHEYPRADMRTKEVWAHTDMLLVSHHPDPTKSRGQYLDLLKVAVTEDKDCPRNAFYYARELTFHSRWEEAIESLNRYLALPGATWPNERCYAMRLLGKSFDETKRYAEALKWYRLAVAEAPGTREPWVDLAMAAYRRSMWRECHSAAMSALDIKDKALVYTMDPEVWGAKPHDLAAIGAHHIGLRDAAVEQGRLAMEANPTDTRLISNLAYYETARDAVTI
jgi:glycosyltransferase involved in cell wall biosynthesis